MSNLDHELEEMGIPAASKPALQVVPPTPARNPVVEQWERYKPLFAQAMDGAYHTIAGVERQILAGQAILWPGRNAAVVTEIKDYEGVRTLQAMWACGDVEEIVRLTPGIEAYGRLMGCAEVLVEGRKAWERVLKSSGYEPWSVTVRKAL